MKENEIREKTEKAENAEELLNAYNSQSAENSGEHSYSETYHHDYGDSGCC